MKSLYYLVSCFFLQINIFGQWFLQNPTTVDKDLTAIFSIKEFSWSIGKEGTIIFSSDGGKSWFEQNIYINENLNSIFFIDTINGFIVGNKGTILKTTNSGSHWELIPQITDYNLNSVVFVNKDTGYAAGGISQGVNSSSITLMTTDGGISWHEQYNSSYEIKSIFFLNDKVGWTLGYNIHFDGTTIKKTTDGGISWQHQTPTTGAYFNDVYFINENTGFCVGQKIIKTTNGGINWFVIDMLTDYFKKIRFVDETNGWILSSRFIYRTNDGGNSWEKLELPVHKSEFANYTNYNSFSTSNFETNLICGNNGTIVKSTNTGASWQILSGILNDLFDVQFLDSLTGFIAAGNGFIYKSNDGGYSWSPTISQTNKDILDIQMLNHNTGWVITKSEVLKTTDGGSNWLKKAYTPNHQYQRFSKIFFIDNLNGWICGNYGAVIHSNDGGESWHIQMDDLGSKVFRSVYFIDPFKGWAVATSPEHYEWKYIIFKTNDGGISWEQIYLNESGYFVGKIIFENDFEGWLLIDNGLLKTTNGGENWYKVLNTRDHLFTDFDYYENKIWMISNYGAVIQSQNSGETWGIQKNNAFSHQFSSIHMSNDVVGWIAGKPNSVHKTVNGGQVDPNPPVIPLLNLPPNNANVQVMFEYLWETDDNSFSRFQVSRDMSFTEIDYEITLINHGILSIQTFDYEKNTKYFWRVRAENQLGVSGWSEVWNFITGDEVLNVKSDDKFLLSFSLSQNYPNPFNPATKIKYTIPYLSKVTLKVFDMLGREVALLVNEEISAGEYEIDFNASNLSSGVYFYQLRAGSFIQTNKMIFLR